MELNWVTVAAQIINFLILVWLLNKFLYGPVTRAMEKRQDRIRSQIREAEERASKAEEERRALKAEREELRAQKEALLADARAEAEQLRHDLERQARTEVDSERKGWLARLERDHEEFLSDIRRRAGEEFVALGRSALKDLADARLETRLAAAFARQLRDLPDATKDRLKQALGEPDAKAEVESGFTLSATDKKTIRQAVTETFGEEVELGYAVNDDLIAGVRLRLDSQVVEWSISNYLDDLQARLGAALDGKHVSEDRKAAE